VRIPGHNLSCFPDKRYDSIGEQVEGRDFGQDLERKTNKPNFCGVHCSIQTGETGFGQSK